MSQSAFISATDDDVVRACLIYVLCEGFLGKEVNDRLLVVWEFTYDDLEDTWNKINKYLSLSEPRQYFKYFVLGITAPFKIWIYEILPYVRGAYSLLLRNKDTPQIKRWSAIKKMK
uniref:Uncharacterized protein n=1 Tax=Lactuca sativa TaxID=4236 RepID=A0A9R1VHS5_LACSA|nr:hypothetical protein LSAT_V11C500276840 [Lactuca sativa]